MKKQSGISEEKELLKKLEDSAGGKEAEERYTGSLLGFCARLLSVKPKADAESGLSLEQQLLERHPAHLAKKADAPMNNPLIV